MPNPPPADARDRDPPAPERGIPVPQRRPALRRAAERTDRLLARDGEPEGGDPNAYHPPQTPGEDNPLALALKVGGAMLVADAVARSLGFEDRTWCILTAAFLATSPPIASGKAALRKIVALFVGIALGVAGALAAGALSGVPMLHIGLVGLVSGFLGTRSPDYLFAAVVGTVVTFVGSGGGDPAIEVAANTVCLVLLGCAIGPAVVWLIERARRFGHERRVAGGAA